MLNLAHGNDSQATAGGAACWNGTKCKIEAARAQNACTLCGARLLYPSLLARHKRTAKHMGLKTFVSGKPEEVTQSLSHLVRQILFQ